jgi:hypothetical protein
LGISAGTVDASIAEPLKSRLLIKNQRKSKMTRGGKREGAGRPSGAINKASAERQAEVAASGITPLEYMLRLMRDEGAEEVRRLDAAKAAAPYVHPRLTAIEHSGGVELTHEQWLSGLK